MNERAGKVHARARWLVLSAAMAVAVLLLILSSAPKARAAQTDVGYQDFSYGNSNAAPTASPTGNKSQSKLWYTGGGTWWGLLFNKETTSFDIYRFNKADQNWSDTGVVVDKRNNTKADTLWDGTHLYVATSVVSPNGSDLSAKLLRYSYDQTAQKYTLDQGFPVSINASGEMEALSLEKDSTGKLWVTFTQPDAQGNSKVYVNHSTDSDSNWGQPFVLPGQDGTTTVSPDDISAIISYKNPDTDKQSIGVMWSNQIDDKVYFASHTDGTADDVWNSPDSTVITGPKSADDHINLKSLQSDPAGRVFAVAKTSYNDGPNADPNAPLIYVAVLGQDGTFTRHEFGKVKDDFTRPILMIDETNRDVYVFAAAPLKNTDAAGNVIEPRAIYYKKAPLDNISFPTGRGTVFIRNSADSFTDNPTSTKQNVTATSGLLVLASNDDRTKGIHEYLHNFIDLSASTPLPDTTAPDTTIDEGPSGTVDNGSASFGFSSSEPNSTFECSLDGAAFTSCTSPKEYTGLKDGKHTFEVKATDAAGNTDTSPASREWTVDTTAPDTTAPDTNITSGPKGFVRSTSARFAFSSSEQGSTFSCSLDRSSYNSCTSPKTYKNLKDGRHVLWVKATDAAGNVDSSPAVRVWVVDTVKPTINSMRPRPGSAIRDRTPTIRATVKDNRTNLSKRNIKLTVDGKRVPARKFAYNTATDRLVYRAPKTPLGRETVRIVARDAAGNVGHKAWYFKIVRR